jgi:hypothetical protein
MKAMRFIHRVGANLSPKARADLERLGLRPPPAVPGDFARRLVGDLVVFEVDESDPVWPAVENWVRVNKAFDTVTTKFTDLELRSASFLWICPKLNQGYPEPNPGEFGYLGATFDLSDYCTKCSWGKKQDRPFRMKREPKWGRCNIMQMHWVYDAIFVRPEYWKKIFAPLGIACKPVLDMKGKVLQTVCQLEIVDRCNVEIADAPSELCAECGRRKCLPVTRGFFPRLLSTPSSALSMTFQWFGSGGSAWHAVIASRELVDRMVVGRVLDVECVPVAMSV